MRRNYGQRPEPYGKRARVFQPAPVPRAFVRRRPTVRQQVPRSKLEVKGMDTDIGGAVGAVLTTTNTNGDFVVLNLIQQGTGSWNRVGRKTHLKSVRVRGIFSLTLTAAALAEASSVLRMVLVWDKQPSGAAIPAWDVIFGNTDQTGAETSTMLANPRFDNMDRFRVLLDRQYHPNSLNITNATTTGGVRQMCIDEFLKLPRLESVYSGQSNPMTIADVSSGALYIAFRQSNSTYGGWSVVDPTWSRVRYFD